MVKKLSILLSVLALSIVLLACGSDNDRTAELGDTFQFDGSNGLVELTFEDNISFTHINNQFSELDGELVIVLPVTMTNIGDDVASLNLFDVTEFGSQGTSLESIDFLVDGDDIRWGSEILPGASLESYFHLLYDGSGQYMVRFAAGFGLGDSVDLVFQVQR